MEYIHSKFTLEFSIRIIGEMGWFGYEVYDLDAGVVYASSNFYSRADLAKQAATIAIAERLLSLKFD